MVHLQYPSMERQDLTQGQLGSFKFTPVDEAPHSPHPHPLLIQQYNQSLQKTGWNGRQTPSKDINDPSFFNQQIKPSLDSSRLRFGSATVRAAVESASTSPRKHFGHRVPPSMRPNALDFQPRFLGSENKAMRSVYPSEDHSLPPSLTTSESFQSSSVDFSTPHASVLKALQSEQIAHEVTKAQLDKEVNARCEAEAENTRLAECNKGLINSINLLKSTVKHLVQKERSTPAESKTLDVAVKEFYKKAEDDNTSSTILYDVLNNYKGTHTTVKIGEKITTTFNLDLLNAPDSSDKSEKAQLQRTLRRQMGISSDAEPDQELSVNCNRGAESIVQRSKQLLIDVPTEQITSNPTFTEVNHTLKPARPEPQTPPLSAPQNGTSKIMLSVPSSFLEKYNKKRSDSEKENLPPVETPHKTLLTCASAVKPHEYDMSSIRVPKVSKPIWMPDCPTIDWKIDNRHRDELRGDGAFVQTRTPNSHFLNYPLRYIPNVLDDNLYRTIMIDFIPFGTPYSDVLNQIRGGTLELIQMYGPIGYATDFVTARVVYTDENGATALYRRGQDPGIKINGAPVRVWQVLEATYPKNKELEEAVYLNGHTRILIIHAPVPDINSLLKRKLRSQIEAGLVLDIGRSHDGVPIVEFTSIEESTKALKSFLDDKEFAGADFDFEEDYCNSRFPDETMNDE